MIMELAIVWLLCAAVFLELASRAPELAGPDADAGLSGLQVDAAETAGVAVEALSLKTATSDRASS